MRAGELAVSMAAGTAAQRRRCAPSNFEQQVYQQPFAQLSWAVHYRGHLALPVHALIVCCCNESNASTEETRQASERVCMRMQGGEPQVSEPHSTSLFAVAATGRGAEL